MGLNSLPLDLTNLSPLPQDLGGGDDILDEADSEFSLVEPIRHMFPDLLQTCGVDVLFEEGVALAHEGVNLRRKIVVLEVDRNEVSNIEDVKLLPY